MGGKKALKKKEGPSRADILRSVIAEILEMYEGESVEPPEFSEVVEILEEAGLGFSIRTDFLRITLGAGVSQVRVTWNQLVIWRDRPWRGKKKSAKSKLPKK